MKIRKTSKIVNPNHSYYLHLYISPSPYVINWSSPRRLLLSMIKNGISGFVGRRRITLGHVNIELVSKNENIPLGMHYKYKTEGIGLLLKKTGLGILFHNMHGRFNTMRDIKFAQEDFEYGKTSIITFIINKKQFDLLKKYKERFLKTGEQYNYGLNNNPLCGPSILNQANNCLDSKSMLNFGAGCSAFVVVCLKQIGINNQKIFNKWYSQVVVGESLIGPYSKRLYRKRILKKDLYKPTEKVDNPVSIFGLFKRGNKWYMENENIKYIDYYSPNLMNKWLVDFIKNSHNDIFSGTLEEIFEVKNKKSNAYQIIVNLN